VLHPATDRDKLLTPEGHFRYNHGGYIWQVSDDRVGDLLTGPKGLPTPPDAIANGQGIPDSFNLRPVQPYVPDGRGLVIGIGEVALDFNGQHRCVSPCSWEIDDASPQQLSFRTSHDFENWQLELERTVCLSGRSVSSHTTIRNQGSELPFTWYPHPFFPNVGVPGKDPLCRTSPSARFVDSRGPDSVGFTQDDSTRFVRRRKEIPGMGYLQLHDTTTPLTVMQNHFKVGLITGSCSFSPQYLPIWGNQNAFSWEPFIERWLAPGEKYSWSIDYTFGLAAGATL
jgi:hypothetical protein